MCKACDRRGKTWEGGDPKCGFVTDTFDIGNWNCATLNALRDIAESLDVIKYQEDCSIAVIPINNGEIDGWIVLSWYKRRGRTSSARFICDDIDEPLTIEKAEIALAQYTAEFERG